MQQNTKKGNYEKALELMEYGLILRQKLFGTASSEYQESCKLLIELYNYLAMTYLRNNNDNINHNPKKGVSNATTATKQEREHEHEHPNTPIINNKSSTKRNKNKNTSNKALKILQKAQKLLQKNEQQHHYPKSKAITYNNLACYYKQKNKLHCALKCLKVCLKLESTYDIIEYSSDTYLNTCVVLSKLGKHENALEHALNALSLLEEELSSSSSSSSTTSSSFHSRNSSYSMDCYERGSSGSAIMNHKDDDHYNMDANHIPIRLDRLIVLTIAYYNIGVEQEYLKLWKECIQSYKKGMNIAYRYLGMHHYMYVTLKSSFDKVMKITSNMSHRSNNSTNTGP